MGKILSVNISDKKGEKKHNIGACRALINQGLENDAHIGMAIRQISLLAAESIEKIRQKGLNVNYGDFAENLTTEGIELFTLPLGTKIKVGNDVLLEVTQIGKTCLDALRDLSCRRRLRHAERRHFRPRFIRRHDCRRR